MILLKCYNLAMLVGILVVSFIEGYKENNFKLNVPIILLYILPLMIYILLT